MDESGKAEPTLAGAVGRAALDAVAPVIEEGVSAVVLLVLILILIPIGVVVLIATSIAFVTVMAVLDSPTGSFATILMLTWFGGTLVALFFCFRAVFRRLPTWIRGREEPRPVAVPPPARPFVAATTRQPSLAELDARLAPPGRSTGAIGDAQDPARTSSRNASDLGERSSE